MYLVVLLLLWPVIELTAAVLVAQQIGIGATLLSLVAISFVGAVLLKRTGLSVWRRANAELAAGRAPTRELLDGPMVLVGGLALMAPGFVSGAFGALLMLPPVRALLRPLLAAWMGTRAARAARSGRFSAIVVDTAVDADGRVHHRTQRFGDGPLGEVIDTEGWDVEPGDRRELPRVIDVDTSDPQDPRSG